MAKIAYCGGSWFLEPKECRSAYRFNIAPQGTWGGNAMACGSCCGFLEHQPSQRLEAAISLYVAHYNFRRVHGSLPGTPAMAARLTGHPWTTEELLKQAE